MKRLLIIVIINSFPIKAHTQNKDSTSALPSNEELRSWQPRTKVENGKLYIDLKITQNSGKEPMPYWAWRAYNYYYNYAIDQQCRHVLISKRGVKEIHGFWSNNQSKK